MHITNIHITNINIRYRHINNISPDIHISNRCIFNMNISAISIINITYFDMFNTPIFNIYA